MDEKKRKNMETFAFILAESDENECFRFMSYIVMRLEYIHGQEMLKKVVYVEN